MGDERREHCTLFTYVPRTRVRANRKLSIYVPGAVKGLDVMFYGDSIFESLRNTSRGGPCERCAGTPEVYDRHFGSKYRSQVLAISGE